MITRSEAEIRAKIQDSVNALEDFSKRNDASGEDFFTVARQATYLTALYWVLGEEVPQGVMTLAVPIIKKMAEINANVAKGN